MCRVRVARLDWEGVVNRLAASAFALVSLLGLSSSIAQVPRCQNSARLADHAGKAIRLADDTLFFRTSVIQLDIDGSPSAYGIRDQGTEDICNGLAPLRPPECKGKVRGTCFAACRASFRAWDGQPTTLDDHMCSVGLGGGSCSTPQARLQSAPRQDWFVSETSYHPAPPAGTSVGDWLKLQDGQLDSTRIAYFVIPGGFRLLPWDATPGDVGVAVGPGGRQAFFLIGDSGGHLDEGSAKLLSSLRGLDGLPTQRKKNAFGVEVERLVGAVAGDYRIAIFRHTAERLPGQKIVLARASAELPAWIERVGRERLLAIGGIDRVRSCS